MTNILEKIQQHKTSIFLNTVISYTEIGGVGKQMRLEES